MYVFIPVILTAVVCILLFIRCKKKPDLSGIYVSFTLNSITLKSKFMSVIISDTQFIVGTVETVNKKGKPAPIEAGTIEYSSSNEAVVTVTENPDDETKFTITAVGAGTAQVNYSADADLGEGVVTITGFVDVEVTPAQATGFNVTFGEAQEQA